MNSVVEDSLIDLLVDRLDGRASSAAMVAWATAALVAGEDTPSLVVLAGLDGNTSVFETTPWLDKALLELNVGSPPPADLRRAFVGMVSRALLAGRMTAPEALDRIHQRAVSPLEHPDDLKAWCFVWENLHPEDYRTLAPNDVEREAGRLAAEWANHRGLTATADGA
jgi:hypothetical protein